MQSLDHYLSILRIKIEDILLIRNYHYSENHGPLKIGPCVTPMKNLLFKSLFN